MKQYVTTAIDFPNAAPHMGHVYEKILADVMVRWFRLKGDEVRFHIGTDENGIKIQQTAKEKGMTPKELVDKNAPVFQDLFSRLGVSFDYFIRTSVPETHWPTVEVLWNRLKDGGYLEKRSYTGLYCTGCERFWRETDLVDGMCPDHKRVPEKVTEENWFFLLSKKEADVKKLLDPKNGSYKMVPDWRGNETFAFLDGGLEDISFSRSKQTLYWGVPVPGDENQVMYVWCDNLTSYISSLGYFTDKATPEWWDGATVTHVIGKDIARFHAINWPAMLQCAGVKTPDRLLIHGFITSEGQKMSKSLGNVVNPEEALAKYGVDALRFYLTHEVPVGNDGDFSWSQFDNIYNGILRNQMGNLLNRVVVLLKKGDSMLASSFVSPMKLEEAIAPFKKTYAEKMDALEFHAGLQAVMRIVEVGNAMMQTHQPWSKDHTPEARTAMLTEFAELLRHVSLLLLPFMPETACKIATQLGVPYAAQMSEKSFAPSKELMAWGGCAEWKVAGEPRILFAPVE